MEDSKKYFISLDNIDIDYLPRLKEYLQGNECNEVPLWSVVNASKSADEICEFELFTKDDKDTKSSECDENNTMEKCCICDTQVPTAYMQAHCTGEKHRVCAAIIRHALHRAAQHAECISFAPTGLTTIPVSLTHSEGTYFCDPCALSVNVEDKGTHEKTKEHRVSVIHDRLLNGLLITYTDKGRVVADSKYEAEVSNGSDVVSVEDVSRDDDVATTPVDDVEIAVAAHTAHEINSDKDEQGKVEDESDAESIDSIDDKVSDDNWVKPSSNSLTDRANINYQEDATTSKKQELVEIVTVSNGIVRVPAKNYHGFSYTLTGSISCLICQKTIVDVDAHILEPRHIELVSVPVTDINCIRQINQLWHHCIICNKLVQSIPHHKLLSPHQSKLRALDVTSKKQQRILKRLNEMSYCDVCNYNIQKNSIESHFNGARHAWNLSRATYTADNRVLHYQYKIDEDKIECAICNIVVRDDDTDAHIVSDAHENNYKRFLVTNHISKLKKSFYCDCCKEKLKLKRTNEIEHSQNVKHKITVSAYKPKLSIPVNVNSIENFEGLDVATIQKLYLLETSNIAKRVTCKVCKHTFKNKCTQIKNHMKKSFHQYNIDALLYVNKIKNKLDGTYFCEVCRSTIDHTKEFNHINNNDHKINLRNEPQESRKECRDISKAAETPAEKYSCDKDIIMRNAPDDMNVNDMSGVAEYVAENLSSKNVDILDRHTVVDHINGKGHNINLRTKPLESGEDGPSKVTDTPAEKDSCDQDIIMRNAPDDMNVNDMSGVAEFVAENPSSINVDILDRHTVGNSKRKLHSHLNKIKDIIVCLICNDEVRANDIDAHTESEKHSNNYKVFLVTNHLTKSKSGYNCHACNVKTDISEIVHVNKKKHKLKIRVYKPETSYPVDVHSIQDVEFLDLKLLYLLESSEEPGEIQCKVCKDTMKGDSMQIKEHLAEKYHQFNVDALLYVNKIKNKLDGTYFCEVCRSSIYRTKEIDHINSNDHKINVRYVPLSWRQRGDDRSSIYRTKEIDHVNSNDHKINVRNVPLSWRQRGDDRSSIYGTKGIDHINSHDHKINVRNVPLSSRQRGDDTTGAPFTLSENPCCRENVKNSCDSDINVEIVPLSCREKGNDKSTSAVPTKTYLTYCPENTTSNVENDHNTVDTSKVQRELNSHLNEIKGETVCFICNVDVHADDIESHNESVHNINVRNVPLSWRQINDDMAGAAATPIDNSSSNPNIKDSHDEHEINVRYAPLACREKGNDMARVAVPPVENTTSNAENDHNTVDNFKREIHFHLKEIKDEIVCLTCNVDVRADEIDSQNESNHNINVRNVPSSWIQIDDDMTGAATAPSEQPTSSGNVKDSNDHEINMKNAPLACKENYSDNSRVTVSLDGNPCVLDRNTVHNNNLKLHYHLKIVKDEIVCSICNIALRDVDIDAHIESDEHNNNYKTFLVENQITMHKKCLFCYTCRSYVKKTICEADHIKTKIHKDKMSVHKPKPSIPVDVNTIQGIEFLDFTTEKLLYLLELCNETEEPEKIACKVCKVIMKSNSMQIKKHMMDQYHQFNIDALLSVNKIKKALDGTYFCEFCRIIIDLTEEIDHIYSNDHKINVRSWKEIGNDIANTSVTPKENSTSNVYFKETLDHIESEKHKQEIIAQNDIPSLQTIKGIEDFDKIIPMDSENYFCECCSVHLVKGTVSEHVERYNHAINVAKYIEKQKTSTSKLKDNHIKKCASNRRKKIDIPNVKLISYKVNDYFKDGEIWHANSSPTGSPEVKKVSKHDMNSYLSAVPSKPQGDMCQICNTGIPNNDANIKDHLKHKTNYKMFLVDKTQLKTVKDCDINVKVPAAKTTKNDTHKTEAFLKAQAIKRIEDCDKIIPIDSEKYFCECCSVHLVKGTVSEHVENYNHAINLAKYIDIQKTSTSKLKDKIIENCTSNCIKYIDGFKDGATSHASKSATGSFEVKKDYKHDMNSYLSVATSKPYEVMCQICNTVIPNTDANKKDHLNGRRHKTNYENFLFDKKKQLKTKEKLPCDNVKEPAAAKTIKNDSIDSSLDINSCLSAVPSKPHEVMCQACNTVIPNTDANKKDHLKGRRHKSNYEKFLVDKKQLKTVKNCDINVNVKVPMAKTTKNDTHKSEALVKAQSIFFKYAEGVLFCRCCNTEVRNTLQDVNLHLSGWRHQVKSSAILAENGLRVDKNKIYCDVCNEFLPNLDGITHIDSSKHKAKVSAKALELRL